MTRPYLFFGKAEWRLDRRWDKIKKAGRFSWEVIGLSQNWLFPNREIVRLGKCVQAPCNSLPTITAPGSTRKKDAVSSGGGADAEAAGVFASKPYSGFWSRL